METVAPVEVRVVLPDGARVEGTYDGERVFADARQLEPEAVEFLCPTSPSKIVCVGMNYADHIEEMNLPVGEEPTLFLKPPSALVGHGGAVVHPPGVEQLDYEGELVAVMGRRCKGVAVEDAMDHVAGFTIGNDFTARDQQLPGMQWTVPKGYDGFAAVGPGLLRTRDWTNFGISTRVNGRTVQQGHTKNLVYGVPELVAYISSVMTLEPGDLIYTGTPSGVGSLRIGDVVDVEIDGIGRLRNTIVDPAEQGDGARAARREESR